jgi:hypothetical protein
MFEQDLKSMLPSMFTFGCDSQHKEQVDQLPDQIVIPAFSQPSRHEAQQLPRVPPHVPNFSSILLVLKIMVHPPHSIQKKRELYENSKEQDHS